MFWCCETKFWLLEIKVKFNFHWFNVNNKLVMELFDSIFEAMFSRDTRLETNFLNFFYFGILQSCHRTLLSWQINNFCRPRLILAAGPTETGDFDRCNVLISPHIFSCIITWIMKGTQIFDERIIAVIPPNNPII